MSVIVLLSFDIFRGRRDTMYGAAVRTAGEAILRQPGIFVSPLGNDANIGTNRLAPVKDINTAIAHARTYGYTNIYVEKGMYSRGSGLRASGDGVVISGGALRITGGLTALSYGWVKSAGDYSVLNANMLMSSRVLAFSNATNVYIDGVVITGGTNIEGAGAVFIGSISCEVTNCIISNVGMSGALGAAVNIISPSRWNTLTFTMRYCSASSTGNLIRSTGSSNTIRGWFYDNMAEGNNIVLFSGSGNIVSASIMSNNCANAVMIMNSPSMVSNCYIASNNVVGFGSVVDFNAVSLTSIPFGVMDSVIFNNYENCTHIIHIANTVGAMPGLRISGNYIGGHIGDTCTGIEETIESSGHTISGNRFNINALGNLYRDTVPGTYIGTGSVITLNMPGDSLHDAAVASGNVTTTSPP